MHENVSQPNVYHKRKLNRMFMRNIICYDDISTLLIIKGALNNMARSILIVEIVITICTAVAKSEKKK